jgi:hypothetical protein
MPGVVALIRGSSKFAALGESGGEGTGHRLGSDSGHSTLTETLQAGRGLFARK